MERIWCDLPEEVLVEIFSWLPPESFIRFKCVSKSWYAIINFLIKDTLFVNKHLRNIDNKLLFSTCLVFFSHQSEIPHEKLFKSLTIFYDDNKTDDMNYVCEDFHLPTLSSDVNLALSSKSHCNGIICLGHHQTIILCNPAIKEWRTLPKRCLPFVGILPQLGFGYDSRANDYKVIFLGISLEEERFRHDRMEYFKIRAEVYSMRIDSWRVIGNHLEFDRFPNLRQQVFCKGVFYWFVLSHNFIVSFIMFDEIFHKIELPNVVVAQKEHFMKVAVWNESVALLNCHCENWSTTNSIDVWVMDDCFGGVRDSYSWTKKVTVGPLVGIQTPLTFLKNDELLMRTTNNGQPILYNLCNQMVRKLDIIQPVNRAMFWLFSYVKSLVSVEGGSQSH